MPVPTSTAIGRGWNSVVSAVSSGQTRISLTKEVIGLRGSESACRQGMITRPSPNLIGTAVFYKC